MNTQATQEDQHANIELRIRNMRTVWVALSSSIVLYYVFTLLVGRSEDVEANTTLSLMLGLVALSTTLISFVIKNKLLTRAVEQQQVQLVQQGYIVALALTEMAALLGVLDFFVTGNRYYYVLFIIAACGMMLHFPRREHAINASFKSPML